MKPPAKPKATLKAPAKAGAAAVSLQPVIVWNETPLGPLWAETDGQGALVSLHWGKPPAGRAATQTHPAWQQLISYFNNSLENFDIEMNLIGTPFQQRAWQTIFSIPYGTVATYADIARHLGTGPRALAGACAKNPLPLFIPCHRVVGSGGALSGYSGAGGLATKKALLKLEGAYK